MRYTSGFIIQNIELTKDPRYKEYSIKQSLHALSHMIGNRISHDEEVLDRHHGTKFTIEVQVFKQDDYRLFLRQLADTLIGYDDLLDDVKKLVIELESK